MVKDRIIISLAFVIALEALTVIVGWLSGNILWTSLLPGAVTMKFTTAISFLCSSMILLLAILSFRGKHNLAITFLPIPCLILSLLMSSLIISLLVGIKTGVENLFVQEDIKAILTVYPGTPSVATIFNFVLVLLVGLLVMIRPADVRKYILYIGYIVTLIGFIGILGYVCNCPVLYYVIEGFSTAIAINTAMAFVLLGIALIMVGRESA